MFCILLLHNYRCVVIMGFQIINQRANQFVWFNTTTIITTSWCTRGVGKTRFQQSGHGALRDRRKGDPQHKCCGKNILAMPKIDFSTFFLKNSSKYMLIIFQFLQTNLFSHNIYVEGLLFSCPWVCRDLIAGIAYFSPPSCTGRCYYYCNVEPNKLVCSLACYLKPHYHYTTIIMQK